MNETTRARPLSVDDAAVYERVREQIAREKSAITKRIRYQLAARRREEAAAAGAATLGERLRAARRARGLTQVRLAKEARLSQGYVSQIERDLREPTLSVGARLAAVLNMSLDELATGSQ